MKNAPERYAIFMSGEREEPLSENDYRVVDIINMKPPRPYPANSSILKKAAEHPRMITHRKHNYHPGEGSKRQIKIITIR